MNMKNVVITGASKGIGEAISLRLSSEGYRVCAIARGTKELKQLTVKGGTNIIPFQADVTDPRKIEEIFQHIEKDLGPIQVLINNAGIYQGIHFWDQDISTINTIIDINLKGSLFCTRLILPYFISRRKGRIINIASVSGVRGIPKETAYGAAKHGMVGMADALAQEVKPYGILVTTICPGAVDTPLWREGDTVYHGDLNQVMRPEEIAGLVSFLLAQSEHTIYKRIVVFPHNEWH